MADALDRFAREYQSYHGLSERRVLDQTKELRAFEDHAGHPLVECDGSDLASYLAKLVEDGLHVNTVRKRGNLIRPFYTWAYGAGLVTGEALMSIRAVRNPKGATGLTLPKPYTPEQLARFRRELDARYPLLTAHRLMYWTTGRSHYPKVAKHAVRLQLEAIVGLALYCGLRRREIFDLRLDDMHPDNEYVVIQSGKGGKRREVPHSRMSRKKVREWLEFREKLDPPHDEPWLSLSPRQPKGGWLKPIQWDRYRYLLSSVGKWRLHRFRHTAATNWLRAGMPLELVSRMLGHASIQQTLGYAEIVKTDIHKHVERLEDAFEEQINGKDT